jgi:hypothetical protein
VREEQLKPLGLGKRNKALGTVIDGVECLAGNAIDCAKTVDDVIDKKDKIQIKIGEVK